MNSKHQSKEFFPKTICIRNVKICNVNNGAFDAGHFWMCRRNVRIGPEAIELQQLVHFLEIFIMSTQLDSWIVGSLGLDFGGILYFHC